MKDSLLHVKKCETNSYFKKVAFQKYFKAKERVAELNLNILRHFIFSSVQ